MLTKIHAIGFYTLVRNETVRIVRIWSQALLPPIITMTLYFVIFGQLIGTRLGTVNGFPYMQYITPGLIMMSVITNSYANVSTSFYMYKFQHTIDELLISPLPNFLILLGFIWGGVFRGLLVGILVLGISLFFTHLPVHHLALMLLTVILSSFLFSLAGFINGILANSFEDITIIPTFVLTPLTYLGGVFFSINMLTGWWQNIALANPILYIVNAFRFSFLNVTDINVDAAFTIIILFAIALFALCWYLFHKGVGIKS